MLNIMWSQCFDDNYFLGHCFSSQVFSDFLNLMLPSQLPSVCSPLLERWTEILNIICLSWLSLCLLSYVCLMIWSFVLSVLLLSHLFCWLLDFPPAFVPLSTCILSCTAWQLNTLGHKISIAWKVSMNFPRLRHWDDVDSCMWFNNW